MGLCGSLSVSVNAWCCLCVIVLDIVDPVKLKIPNTDAKISYHLGQFQLLWLRNLWYTGTLASSKIKNAVTNMVKIWNMFPVSKIYIKLICEKIVNPKNFLGVNSQILLKSFFIFS